MHVIITCKYKKEWMKNSREKVETPFFPSYTYLLPWKPVVESLMYVIITCKYEKDPIKNSLEKERNILFPIISLWGFFSRSRAANLAVGGQIRPKFELVPSLMHVIVTCKYEKERMKNSREKVETPFFPS